jgi:hypothetical protein
MQMLKRGQAWQWPAIFLGLTVVLFLGLFDTGLAVESYLKDGQVFDFDYNGDGKQDLCLYRPGAGAIYILRSGGVGTFKTVYAQGNGGAGIARYNLSSANDRVFPFDFNGDGKSDLCLYRPGTGAIFIARSNGDGTFTAVYKQGNPGKGIAGYSLRSVNDRVFPFDFNGDGKSDLCLYRPGAGAIYIARSNGDGTFTAVYRQGDPGSGIAGYSLRSSSDRVFPFDFNGDGRSDLCLYRPGAGAIYIAGSNGDGTFTAVYRQGDPGSGIAGYSLRSSSDRVFPFDYNGDGRSDLCLYRPGAGAIAIVRSNGDGTFYPVYFQGAPGSGIAGYSLRGKCDQVFPFDYNGDGKQDLCLYRPGTGAIFVVRSNGNGTFTAVYREGAPGLGIAGYGLKDINDRVFACDHNGDGDDDLCLYIPGTGAIAVIESACELQ